MKYLLTGGSGNLGTELQKYLKCFAPNRRRFNITGDAADLLDEVIQSVGRVKGVIHTAAYTNVPGAEANRKDALLLNVIGTRNIKSVAKSLRVPLYYISTDYVYEGVVGGYKETSPKKPINYYAWTKAAGEEFCDVADDLIIRTSFKPAVPWPFPKAFTDLYTSCDYVDVIAKDIALAIEKDIRGVVNIGTERKSIYDLASRRNPNVRAGSVEDIKCVSMPKDISMDITKWLNIKGENNE